MLAAGGAAAAAQPSGQPETVTTHHVATQHASAEHGTIQQAASQQATVTWSAQDAIAGLAGSEIFAVPGAVARMDENAVTAALSEVDAAVLTVKVLLLPFSGLADEDRKAYRDEVALVTDWAAENDTELLILEGLQVSLPGLYSDLVPTDLGELQPILLRHDLTSLVLGGIDRIVADVTEVAYVDKRADPELQVPATNLTPADAELVKTVGDELADNELYVDPRLDTTITRTESWDIDVPTRVAVFPVLEPDETLPGMTTALAARFPSDIVIVMHGDWIEIAGPQPELLSAALLELYGEFYPAITEWGAPQSGLIRILIEKVGLWRTGVVTDLAPPDAAPDPVNTVKPLLPWLFVLVALVLGTVVVVRIRGRRLRSESRKLRQQHDHDRAGAELALLATRLMQADRRAGRTGLGADPESAHLVRASERYRTARDLLQRNGSIAVVVETLDSANRDLDSIANRSG